MEDEMRKLKQSDPDNRNRKDDMKKLDQELSNYLDYITSKLDDECPLDHEPSLGKGDKVLISEDTLEMLGFTPYNNYNYEGSPDMYQRDGVKLWKFNDEGWLIDALDQGGIDVRFQTFGELDEFWKAIKLGPLL